MHPYFLEHQSYLSGRVSNKEELLNFLKMVKLKEEKLRWSLRQKNKKNKDLAFLCGIKVRRFQQLKAEYRKTGDIPKLNPKRRPRTELNEEQEKIILRAVEESKLNGALTLRLYIKRYYGVTLPRDKLHNFLLKQGISKPDKKKQKQRKYCRYERKHSFSLVHLDWHESKVVPGKWVCAVEDDASRLILCGGEFDDSIAEHNIKLMVEAIDLAYNRYSAIIREANTDKGSQFYANKYNEKGDKGKCKFEKFLKKKGINHIPSRRNHPQTNGKEERWFRTYEEKRGEFKSFKEFIEWYNNRLHLGLSRTEAITPNDAVMFKLQPRSILGLFFKEN